MAEKRQKPYTEEKREATVELMKVVFILMGKISEAIEFGSVADIVDLQEKIERL